MGDGMGRKRAFGNSGQVNDVDLALGSVNITPSMTNRIVTDPIIRATVGAVIRGEILPAQVAFEDLLAREIGVTKFFCETANVAYPGDIQIEKALRLAEAKCGISVHSRFVLGGLGLPELFNFFYRFNEAQEKDNKPTLKLGHEIRKEWWRTDSSVQHVPTSPGVFTWDFQDTMRPTDLASRPFYLNAADQRQWALGRGGSGLSTAEQITFLFQRCLIETGLPMWGCGSIRSENAYGPDRSLRVLFDADDGFCVSYCSHGAQYWHLGALPEVFAALVP